MKRNFIIFFIIVLFTTAVFAQHKTNVSKAPQKSNTDIELLIDRYFDSLNETNDALRRELIEEVWTERGKFGTPYGEVEGRDAIDKLTKGVFEKFPNTKVRRTSKIDGFGNYLRWSFTLSDANNRPILSGVDFAILADGKLQLVMGFFDFAPGLNAKSTSTGVR